MKLGLITDSLPSLSFEDVLVTASRLALDTLEFGCGNWSSAPHIDLQKLVQSASARKDFLAALSDHRLSISALNCSGNPLYPGEKGKQHDSVTRDTIRLASQLGVERVVLMSGCPAGPGDSHPNWVTTEWPEDVRDLLRWQWDEVLLPYWRDLVSYSENLGIKKLCLELHGHQNVYNVATLKKLRDAVGETVGTNFDPSHLMWMGADPCAAVRALGPAIYHVHAKDTRIDPIIASVNGNIDTVPGNEFRSRSWSYVTLGYGHGEAWWGEFCASLAMAGYDDVLSIEHEDFMISPLEGVEKSVALLDCVLLNRTIS